MIHSPHRMEIFRTRDEIHGFFQRLGIRYLSRTRVAWKPLLSMDLSASTYYRENRGLFDDLCRDYGKMIDSGHLAPLYIRKINEAIGYGVFAAAPIREAEFIGEYAGVVQPESAATGAEEGDGSYESDYSWYYLDPVPSGPTLEINGRWEGNELRFVNHGPAPNVAVEHTLHEGQWVLFFRAACDIAPDEQLLIDYGDGYWEDGYRDERAIG
ncbi:MAG: SET domain-containing protein-lysine N-methyltransferase [Pseudomonadota bacterium]